MKEQGWSRRQLLKAGGGAAGLAMLPACTAGKKERITITQVDLHKIVVPMKPDITADPELAESSNFDAVPKMVLKIHTDSGLTETARLSISFRAQTNSLNFCGRKSTPPRKRL